MNGIHRVHRLSIGAGRALPDETRYTILQFQSVKKMHLSLPVLSAPILDLPLVLGSDTI